MGVDSLTPEVMRAFYARLYPSDAIFAWLNQSHSPTRLFTFREFSFTLPGDIYLRYKSFHNADDLLKNLTALNPTRFEIGPIYSAKPKEKRTVRDGNFYPLLRELVFDIDMTDYDSIRTCCSSADICDRCWGFIAAAVQVLHTALTDHFGFKHILWVYSGRRGIHVWVSDREAMELTDDQRRALVGYVGILFGSKDSSKMPDVRIGPSKALPPSLQATLEPLAHIFSHLILEDQDCFRSTEGWEALLDMIPNPSVVSNLRNQWSSSPGLSSTQKWAALKAAVKKFEKNSPAFVQMKYAMEDIILTYTYPRLDAEVSKHRNHLLKAPFCVHPKTGRVCVPVDPERVSEFKMAEVPTVSSLMRELDEVKASPDTPDKPGRGSSRFFFSLYPSMPHETIDTGWERTSLKPYVEMLERHARAIMEDVRQEMLRTGGKDFSRLWGDRLLTFSPDMSW
jgi:DNA primase small subunit